MARALGGRRARRIAEHAVGRHAVDADRPQAGGDRRRAARSRRPSPARGARGPAAARAAATSRCARRGRRRSARAATTGDAARPSRSRVVTARSTASRLPPWPLTSTTPPDQSAERTSSTIDRRRDVGADRQRAGEAGVLAAGRHGERRADDDVGPPVGQSAARASATIVSVSQRQVRSVLLARADGDAQQRPAVGLGPRHLRQLHTGDGNPSPSAAHRDVLTSSELEVVPSAPMQAIRQHEFGPPDVLRAEIVPDLHPGPEQVRVAVEASGVHLLDTSIRRGEPGSAPAAAAADDAGSRGRRRGRRARRRTSIRRGSGPVSSPTSGRPAAATPRRPSCR